MNHELIVVATFTAKPGKSDALRQALHDLVAPTRLEAGCLLYSLNQGLEQPNVFTMLERFASQEAFDEHNNKPYIVHFKQNLLEKLVEMNSISIVLYSEVI